MISVWTSLYNTDSHEHSSLPVRCFPQLVSELLDSIYHRLSAEFVYVSDWLLALDLEDYLGHFIKAGYGSTRCLVDLCDCVQIQVLLHP
jgi:hypothetical protein